MPIPPLRPEPAISAFCWRWFSCFFLFAAAGLFAFSLTKAWAGDASSLIIPPADGYSFEDCLKAQAPCGLVVADAWCKAHGFARSEGFGPADQAGGADVAPGSFNVTCVGRLD